MNALLAFNGMRLNAAIFCTLAIFFHAFQLVVGPQPIIIAMVCVFAGMTYFQIDFCISVQHKKLVALEAALDEFTTGGNADTQFDDDDS